MQESYFLRPIGFIHSDLKERSKAPKQGPEGAPDAWLEMAPEFMDGLLGVSVNQELVLVTWLHQARREVLQVHPRSKTNPLTGVFATRSPDRPNPLGLHRVRVLEIVDRKIKLGPLEAIDGTPVVDIKLALAQDGPRVAATGGCELRVTTHPVDKETKESA